MIKMIAIPRLKLAQLQTLTESTLSIAAPITVVANQLTALQTTFDQFLEGLQKDRAASDKATLDKTRDQIISGFMLHVRAEDNFPHTDESLRNAIRSIRRITERYGFAITRLPYNQQSAQVDNMLGELEKVDMTGLEMLSRWLTPIKAANDAFKSAADTFVKDVAATAQLDAASTIAPDLLTSLESLFTMMFAHAQVAPTDELTQAYLELSVLVDSYR